MSPAGYWKLQARKKEQNGVKAAMTTEESKKHKNKLHTINTLINLLKINLKIQKTKMT